jgi:hypothetical protein
VSRLDYAPKLKEIQVTDIQKGLGVFSPKPDKPVSFAALKATLKSAGYTLDSADITVAGTLAKNEKGWAVIVKSSGQRFALEGPNADQSAAGTSAGAAVEITGDWQTIGVGPNAYEVILPVNRKAARGNWRVTPFANFAEVRFAGDERFASTELNREVEMPDPAKPPAPIRVTSPGLTVYKGGAVTPRLYVIRQHLGTLEVNRQAFDLAVSYTPSPRVQLEVEAPISRTAFDDQRTSGAGVGLGNITLWSKYRFFRKVKTYGDRQAAVRFGLELPTGKKDAPTLARINAPAFVRQQLTPISGGLTPHFDVAFSQAGGRFIFGGNAEGMWRTERDGFRMGHELRLNTDLEYVLLPRNYHRPGHELFLILETTFVHRAIGRTGGLAVPGSTSTDYYVAPGLQYAAHPQFVIEGSIQLPLVRNDGPLVLRTDRNILFGIRYLF